MRVLQLLLGACAAAVFVLGTGGVAHAAPSPAQIEAQINQVWNTLEPIIEKADLLKDQINGTQKQVTDLQNKIQPLQLQIDLAMTRVSAISVDLYMTGPGSTLNALLVSGSPTAFVDQLTTLNSLSRNETRSVSQVMVLKSQYDTQKAPLDVKLAQLKQEQATYSAQAATINKQIAALNQLRLAAYGATQGTGNLRPVTCPQVYDGSPGAKAAQYACQQIGKPYQWAADGPGSYDCSGLTLAAWRSVGVSLPHNAYEQKRATTRVSYSQLHVGDLVFYYSDTHHVTIWVGNGWVVSAPTFGEPVQMQKFSSNSGNVTGYGRVR
jgi:cell wall-associated NlpC family hydrolase